MLSGAAVPHFRAVAGRGNPALRHDMRCQPGARTRREVSTRLRHRFALSRYTQLIASGRRSYGSGQRYQMRCES